MRAFGHPMSPRGDKSSYTSKQRRQAHHIEESEKQRGRSSRTAERIGWATVNKQDRGGKKKRSRSAGTRRKTSRRPKRGGSKRKTASRSR
jgi:hypothetical protein